MVCQARVAALARDWHVTSVLRVCPELGCRLLQGASCSWFVFPFGSPSALGSRLVCHPGLLLSIVGAEERLPGCSHVAGLGSEACPESKTTRPRPPSASGRVHLLLWFLSSIRTSHDGTFGKVGCGRRIVSTLNWKPVPVSNHISKYRLPWNENFWLRYSQTAPGRALGENGHPSNTVPRGWQIQSFQV